jgi:hypothetical protein
MARRRSAHLTRLLIEGVSSFSPYHGAKLAYLKEYDPCPVVNVGQVAKMDIERAIAILYRKGQLSNEELMALRYVMSDGRLSRRDISAMIERDYDGLYMDQRTVSRRLESAYLKIQKILGFEYSDARVFKMIAKRRGYPEPYLLSDEEIAGIQSAWERI